MDFEHTLFIFYFSTRPKWNQGNQNHTSIFRRAKTLKIKLDKLLKWLNKGVTDIVIESTVVNIYVGGE